MLKNYIKIATRNLWKNKSFSFINIIGLTIGLTSVILIGFYINDELKYDRFLKDADHIYQVNFHGNNNGNEFEQGTTPPAAGPEMVREFPEVEACTRIYWPGDVMVLNDDGVHAKTYFTEQNLWAVDSNFLQVFSYRLLEGSATTCLQNPNGLVITEHIAKKYFGSQDALGKTLLLGNDKKPFNITGVLADLPSQSTFRFEMLAPVSAYPVVKKRSWNWQWLQVSTYIKLKNNVSVNAENIKALEAKFPAMIKAHAFKTQEKYAEFVAGGGKMAFSLQPFTSLHLHSANIGTRLTTFSDIKYIYIFSAIAAFIIILACVNFMNLSTARAVKRAKEVGIRKALGSGKGQLVRQFLSEALLNSFIASVLAVISVLLLLKPFNDISGKTFSAEILLSVSVFGFIALLWLLTGLLAGSYPAFYLTAFKPALVLKGAPNLKPGRAPLFVRNGLVIFQFAVSALFIICSLIVFSQLRYLQNKDIGLTKENVIVIANCHRVSDPNTFRNEISRMPDVISAGLSSSIPTKGAFGDSYVPEAEALNSSVSSEVALPSFLIDDYFIPSLKIDVLKGRSFSSQFNDSASVILNEAALKLIGWKEPVGKYLDYPGNGQRFKVVGIVKDFNVESLHSEVSPFALFHFKSKSYDLGTSYLSVRVKPGQTSEQLTQLEQQWKSFAPDTPFDYSFLDAEFDALYRKEQQLATVIGLFTGLSIFIACLGLFGLAAYTAERRIKEIGIRKVLGAGVPQLVNLLSRDLLLLVIVASLLAFPIAWYAMNKWLQEFAYRINISWWMFAAAAGTLVLIALITVSFQTIKAALANPVKSIRTE